MMGGTGGWQGSASASPGISPVGFDANGGMVGGYMDPTRSAFGAAKQHPHGGTNRRPDGRSSKPWLDNQPKAVATPTSKWGKKDPHSAMKQEAKRNKPSAYAQKIQDDLFAEQESRRKTVQSQNDAISKVYEDMGMGGFGGGGGGGGGGSQMYMVMQMMQMQQQQAQFDAQAAQAKKNQANYEKQLALKEKELAQQKTQWEKQLADQEKALKDAELDKQRRATGDTTAGRTKTVYNANKDANSLGRRGAATSSGDSAWKRTLGGSSSGKKTTG